jgi:uncharacterized protein (TIGR03067 family)
MKPIVDLTFFLAVLLCLSAGKVAAPPTDDAKNIQGTWKIVSWLAEGREETVPESMRVIINAETLVIGRGETTPQDTTGFKYTIDSAKDPKQMDWLVQLDPDHTIRQLAIYALDGDTLKINCAAADKPRPTNFENKKGRFESVWILKRIVLIAKPTDK